MTVDSHHAILDAITEALNRPENRKGLTLQALADTTGFAKARVKEVLDASECGLKRRSHNKTLWWMDWSEIDRTRYSPPPKRGRPKKKVTPESAQSQAV